MHWNFFVLDNFFKIFFVFLRLFFNFFLFFVLFFISDFFPRLFCHQRIYDTTLGSRDRGWYPERYGEGEEEEGEGLVLEYSLKWIGMYKGVCIKMWKSKAWFDQNICQSLKTNYILLFAFTLP